MNEEIIKKQHCGTISTSAEQTMELMPDLIPTLLTFPDLFMDYLFDVKVHMLMPDQWPCIPNWHYDFVPRDNEGKQDFSLLEENLPDMYLLLSGPPFTEFRDERKIEAWKWNKFNQLDEHRGMKSKEFGWRLFIRAVPKSIVPEKVFEYSGIRRHSQVYIESNFKW